MNMATEVPEKTHECKRCGQLFEQLSPYKEHERTHPEEKPYTCKHCKKSFRRSLDCKRHERTHTGEKPYTCKHCDKCFSDPSACKQHERTHTGVKPYSCKHCNKCFSRSSARKDHERTHTGEKPYSCKHCKKNFRRSLDCKVHERTHTGEKPYTCKHCDKRFSDPSAWKQHERIHTGVKPYFCKHCNKCFSRSPACKEHERTHTEEWSRIHASIVKSVLVTHQLARKINELTQETSRIHSTDRVRTEQERKLTRLQRNKDKKRPKTDDNWVRNTSSRPLDKTETHVLSYGLKHSVTPKRIPTESIVSSVEAVLSRQRDLSASAKDNIRSRIASRVESASVPDNNLTDKHWNDWKTTTTLLYYQPTKDVSLNFLR